MEIGRTHSNPINVPTFMHDSDGRPMKAVYMRDTVLLCGKEEIKTQSKHFPNCKGLKDALAQFSWHRTYVFVRMT